jgi:hypothetical protein
MADIVGDGENMNGLLPAGVMNTLLSDTETGTYGDAKRLVVIDVTAWSDEDISEWETMTDSERGGYGIDVVAANEQTATPTEYMRELGR